MPPFSPSPFSLKSILNPPEDIGISGSTVQNPSWADRVEYEESMAADSMVEETTPTATPLLHMPEKTPGFKRSSDCYRYSNQQTEQDSENGE
ncbi:hypothetical protein DFH28DRAFT_1117139 [Melampsora americana]|nr:hypothetical protein DFH28DRAFT_1117139 [Melampsora americana]